MPTPTNVNDEDENDNVATFFCVLTTFLPPSPFHSSASPIRSQELSRRPPGPPCHSSVPSLVDKDKEDDAQEDKEINLGK